MTAGPITSLAAAVLAGGHSRRMGRDKALLLWQGERLLDRQVRLLRSLFPAHLLLSTRSDAPHESAGATPVFDRETDRGPLGALDALFAHAPTSHLLVVAVDMPHLNPEVLHALLERCTETAGVVPLCDGRLEPLAAIYPRACQARIPALLRHGRGAMRELIEPALAAGEMRTWSVPPDWAKAFANWNEPGDMPPKPMKGE